MLLPAYAAHARLHETPDMRTLARMLTLATLLTLSCPSISRAGDAPIYVTPGGWGVGQIDNKILFYLGPNHYLETPIPAPPEGPRWDRFRRTMPSVSLTALAAGALT